MVTFLGIFEYSPALHLTQSWLHLASHLVIEERVSKRRTFDTEKHGQKSIENYISGLFRQPCAFDVIFATYRSQAHQSYQYLQKRAYQFCLHNWETFFNANVKSRRHPKSSAHLLMKFDHKCNVSYMSSVCHKKKSKKAVGEDHENAIIARTSTHKYL